MLRRPAAPTVSRPFGRRRLPMVLFLLGLGSIVLSETVVVVSLIQSREIAEQNYLRTTRNEVRMLANEVDLGRKQNTEQLLITLGDSWIQLGHWTREPDEHFVIVDNLDSEVVLDTVYQHG